MRIIFNDIFNNSDYADDSAAREGRMETIVSALKQGNKYTFETCTAIQKHELEICHTQKYISQIYDNRKLFEIASYAAGATLKAVNNAMNGLPSFACVRPPGHHAYSDNAWGHCFFNNMAIALKTILKKQELNIFLLDFDAHTGDGTRDLLKDNNTIKILNPTAGNADNYIKEIKNYIASLPRIDLIAVCAGFDSYEKDVGKKLRTFDYYHIGSIMSDLAKKNGHKRKFAVLEGGYYLPDLGKNVVSFCDGFLK